MTITIDELLQKAYSYSDGNCDASFSESEFKFMLTEFSTFAANENPNFDDKFDFGQLVITIFTYGIQDKFDQDTIVNQELRGIYEKVAKDF